MKHTKLPWYVDNQWDKRVDGYAIKSYSDVIGWTAYLGGTTLPKENAAFIVKAVNNHYQLVETLENIIAETVNEQTDWDTLAHIIDEIRRQARKTLAQVEDL